MKKLIVMVLLSLCAFSVLGDVYVKVNNNSFYDDLKVECIANGTLIQSVKISPYCDGEIKIPVKKDDVNYKINLNYNDKSVSVSLDSVRDYFGKIGLKYDDDYSDDGNGLSGDLEQSKIYYSKIDLSI